MPLKMVLPKGRQFDKITGLLGDIGTTIAGSERNYRPKSSDPNLDIKLLKSKNIPQLVAMGQHDCGFAGLDWIQEQSADVVSLLDLGLDPVRIVVCIPEDWDWQETRQRKLIAVSEYKNLTTDYLQQQRIDYTFLLSYGATEVFPPEDADLVVDNTSTGSTLQANRLKIVDTIMTSTTQFIAHKTALKIPEKASALENMVLLFEGVLEGRKRVLLEMNCPADRIDALVNMLPAMKSPTVSKLYREEGFSVKAAVPRKQVAQLIPKLRQGGATDILETPIYKVLP